MLLLGTLAFLYFGGTVDGEEVFVRAGCKGCHMIRGEGAVIWSDLRNVTSRRNSD